MNEVHEQEDRKEWGLERTLKGFFPFVALHDRVQ